MITCEEAAIICNKDEYKEASFLERLKLRMHLFFCKTCPGFVRKNHQLTRLCQKAYLHCLSDADKLAMSQKLKKNL